MIFSPKDGENCFVKTLNIILGLLRAHSKNNFKRIKTSSEPLVDIVYWLFEKYIVAGVTTSSTEIYSTTKKEWNFRIPLPEARVFKTNGAVSVNNNICYCVEDKHM